MQVPGSFAVVPSTNLCVQVNAAIISNYNLEQLKLISLYSADNVEKILGILYNPDEVRKVAALQKSGEPVAERLMNAGKQVCSSFGSPSSRTFF